MPQDGGALDLVGWAASNVDFISQALLEHGALLFRGFAVTDAPSFREAFSALAGAPLPYVERSSPRRVVGDGVFTSTAYPEEREIQLHNEQSYNHTFPRLIAFYCRRAARSGGETPVADTRKVLERLDASLIQRLIDEGYSYVR